MNLTGRKVEQKPPKLTPEEKAYGKLYMGYVAKLPCVICGDWPVHVHHVICGRYSGKKATDTETIPLCPTCHQQGPLAIHNGKASWVKRNGPDTAFIDAVRAQVERLME